MSCKNCSKEFASGFQKGRESAYRKNEGGCYCLFNENDNIVQLCAAHKNYIDDILKDGAIEYIKNSISEISQTQI